MATSGHLSIETKITMKSMVTGGAGFLGSHMVDRLLREGHDVIVLDNFSTGRPQNLAHVSSSPRLNVIPCDIARDDMVAHVQGMDWIFHFAARGDIVPSIEEPMEYFTSNVTGTVRLLEAARKAEVKRIVYAASSSCYGMAQQIPTLETAPIQPQYPYALTKYLAEQCLFHWGQVYKLSVNSIRIFNAYGPRSRTSGTYGAVFGVFLAQKIHERPFTVVGDGTQVRDFVFVTDVVDAFYRAAETRYTGEVFNVGSGRPQAVNRLVQLLGATDIVHLPKRPGEPDVTHADISKIRHMLGWEPKVSFEEGVATLLKNIDYWKEAPVWTPASIHDATQGWFHYLSR